MVSESKNTRITLFQREVFSCQRQTSNINNLRCLVNVAISKITLQGLVSKYVYERKQLAVIYLLLLMTFFYREAFLVLQCWT